MRQVLPSRLRQRVDAIQVSAAGHRTDPQVDTALLVTLSAAIRAGEELRFDYRAPGRPEDAEPRPSRRVQPHHLVARAGRWYVVGADRMTPRVQNGPRFTPRKVPGGDVAAFLSARFKGSGSTDAWPCRGEVILDLPVTEVAPFAGDGVVEALGTARTRLTTGSWSWAAFAELSRRAGRAAGTG